MGCAVLAAGLVTQAGKAATASWYPLGPYGGDARSFAADPADSKHLFLGTATGWIYDSHDGGSTWKRVAQIANRNDLVVDNIVVDQHNPKRLIVGAFTAVHPGDGGLFISEDYGKNWYSQAEMRGQSVRALARSSSNPSQLVAGTLKGVFQSMDNGTHWKQISPEGSAEIHEVESIAIDPADPNVIYAGTWHLPWKTTDGGATWHNIKQGIIDDSDVFSIIVDPKDPKVVYASACSGIYKSSDAGDLFHKVQGIPSTARRTRKLEQDPEHLDVVFAGTTEGLYRTLDAGAQWERMTPDDVIVNDVYVDPQNAQHVLVATDRGGVYRSEDGGTTFEPSNDGFSARQVTAYAADAQGGSTLYVGVVNDKKTGGVFESTDGAVHWQQQSEGLNGRDVFSLVSLADGTLLAGTGHGIFRLNGGTWADSSLMEGAPETKKVPKAEEGKAVVLPARPAARLLSARSVTPVRRAVPVRRSVSVRQSQGAEHKGRLPLRSSVHKGTGRGSAVRPSSRLVPVRAHVGARGTAHLVRVRGQVPTKHTGQPIHLPAPTNLSQGSAKSPKDPKDPKDARAGRVDAVVYSLVRSGDVLLAGSGDGLLRSTDAGQHWSVVKSLAMPEVHYVAVLPAAKDGAATDASTMVAAGLEHVSLTTDGGATWSMVPLPQGLTQVGAVGLDADKDLWIGGREGVWYSTDFGANWKTLQNLFVTEVDSLYYDAGQRRMLVTSFTSPVAFSVQLPDYKVTYWDTGWKLRFVRPVGNHLVGATLFDGVVVQPEMVDTPFATAATPGK